MNICNKRYSDNYGNFSVMQSGIHINNPVISVIMPVYNSACYLSEAVQSILGQTYRDFELIIVNDGSTDASSEIIQTYGQQDARIVYISQEHLGITKTLNRALQITRGTYIARQDADDISMPDRLEKLTSAGESHSLVVSLWKGYNRGNLQWKLFPQFLKILPTSLLLGLMQYGNLFVHGTYFFRKDDVLTVGGYREQFECTQDYDLFLRVREKHAIGIVRKPLYGLRKHNNRVSVQKKKQQYWYEIIASFFAYERKKQGNDSYSALHDSTYEVLAYSLAQRYFMHYLGIVLCAFFKLRFFTVLTILFTRHKQSPL